MREGFERVAHLRTAVLPGGDAAASYPVQAAAGFLAQLNDLPDFTAPPFSFPARYRDAVQLVRQQRSLVSPPLPWDGSSTRRRRLLGFTREITFEGQAAMWLERLATHAPATDAYPFPVRRAVNSIFVRCFRRDSATAPRPRPAAKLRALFSEESPTVSATRSSILCHAHDTDTVVLSGGVFQNECC